MRARSYFGQWVLAGAIGFATIAGVAACAESARSDPVNDTGGNDTAPPDTLPLDTGTDDTEPPPDTDTDAGCNADCPDPSARLVCYPAAKGCPDFYWACWPLPPESPPSTNYTVKTICGGKVVIDKTTGLMWARDQEPGWYTWDNAKKACKDSKRAGFSDWRLPTRIELVSLVDFGKITMPTIDTTAFPGASKTSMWSSSASALSSGNAWLVDFGPGGTNGYATSAATGVRCVR